MNFAFVISYLLIFTFGFRIFSKNLDELSEKNRIRASAMTKIVALYVVFAVCGLLLSCFLPMLAPIFCYTGIFFGKTASFFESLCRRRRMRQALVPLLDSLLLQMAIGDSLRSAAERAVARLHAGIGERFQCLLLQAEDNIDVKDLDPRVGSFRREYLRASQQSFHARKIISGFRERIALEDRFHSRIHQVTMQLKMQVALLSTLFAMALIHQLFSGGWQNSFRVILVSVLIYIVGSVIMWRLPKRFRWNL